MKFYKGRIIFLWLNLNDCQLPPTQDVFMLKLKSIQFKKPNQKISLDAPNLGIILLDFLKWYGIEMNYS
jgi:hypothetical protein